MDLYRLMRYLSIGLLELHQPLVLLFKTGLERKRCSFVFSELKCFIFLFLSLG